MNQSIIEQIRKDEQGYETALQMIAEKICQNLNYKIILIAGGSCAGKTTTTRKLSQLIDKGGRKCHTVSLDDYYRNLDESVYLPDGTRDIESINSLRVDMIRESMTSLLNGRETSIPMFDFKTAVRTDDCRRITLGDTDVVIIEGLHALNLSLFETPPDKNQVFGIYLFADAGDDIDCRFVRRLVRDSRYRNSDAEELFAIWKTIKANERESIEPFEKYADVSINTFFPYERSILNDDAILLLEKVEETSLNYKLAHRFIAVLEQVPQITHDYIPENSLMHEFI